MNIIVNLLGNSYSVVIPENTTHFWLSVDENGEVNSHFDFPRYDFLAEGWRSETRTHVAHLGYTVSSNQAKDICIFYTIKCESEKICDFTNVSINDVVKFMANIKPDNLAEGFIRMVVSHLNNAEECTTFKDGILYCYDTKSRDTRIMISQNRVYLQNGNLAFCMQMNDEGVIVSSGWEYEAANNTPEIMLKEAALCYCMPIDDKNLVIFMQLAMSAWRKAEEVDTNAL